MVAVWWAGILRVPKVIDCNGGKVAHVTVTYLLILRRDVVGREDEFERTGQSSNGKNEQLDGRHVKKKEMQGNLNSSDAWTVHAVCAYTHNGEQRGGRAEHSHFGERNTEAGRTYRPKK